MNSEMLVCQSTHFLRSEKDDWVSFFRKLFIFSSTVAMKTKASFGWESLNGEKKFKQWNFAGTFAAEVLVGNSGAIWDAGSECSRRCYVFLLSSGCASAPNGAATPNYGLSALDHGAQAQSWIFHFQLHAGMILCRPMIWKIGLITNNSEYLTLIRTGEPCAWAPCIWNRWRGKPVAQTR